MEAPEDVQEAAGGGQGSEQQPIYFRYSRGRGPGWAVGPGQWLERPLSSPREFRFTSEVPIWLDYHGKHVTMDQVVGGAIRRGS